LVGSVWQKIRYLERDTMTIEKFDAIVIGTGQAGPPIAARCSKEGLRTAVIECGPFGGTCVNVGCTPTKTLVASARALHLARRGAEFGFLAGEIRADMARIKARKDSIVAQSRDGVTNWMHGLDKAEVIVGEAAHHLDIEGIDDVPTLDNRTIMELDEVPEHLVIIGGSYIGLEFAQMMRRFGAQVTVVEQAGKLLHREDEDVSDGIRNILEGDGVAFELGAKCLKLSRDGKHIVVGAQCGPDARSLRASHVLLAVGRRPNTDRLGLDKAGIKADERGYIVVDDQCRSSADGVWAVGDCNGRGAFTHTSYNDHEIVVANLFDNDARTISDRIPCYALFIDPALGRVGMTETEVRKSGRKALIGTMEMKRVGRARESGETQGFMKVLVDAANQQILGASILGMNGDEVVHSLLDLMAAGQPYTVVSRGVHIHPTVSELLPTLLQGLRPLE
jgi:pyruvate/2-oxoglutarate dehydrogenase complex dihydrolipoamide dehydrogenase (E3) component